jgi:LysR family transcriptional regulator for bpeEF and oprC
MDRLQAMQVFTRVVDTNSFTRAAETLDLPRASVTTIIQNLESFLGTRLMHRTTRRLSLTPDGAAYYERCVRILADVEETEASFQSGNKKPHGKLRIDMPGAIGRLLVIPSLCEFHTRYPDIDLQLGLTDRPVDLLQEGDVRGAGISAEIRHAAHARRPRVAQCRKLFFEPHGARD